MKINFRYLQHLFQQQSIHFIYTHKILYEQLTIQIDVIFFINTFLGIFYLLNFWLYQLYNNYSFAESSIGLISCIYSYLICFCITFIICFFILNKSKQEQNRINSTRLKPNLSNRNQIQLYIQRIKVNGPVRQDET